MVLGVTIGTLQPEDVLFDSKTMHENDLGITKQDIAGNIANLSNGSAVTLIRSQDDLTLINGFRQLEIDKNPRFIEPGFYTDPILIPAGWTGIFTKSFFNSKVACFISGSSIRDEISFSVNIGLGLWCWL